MSNVIITGAAGGMGSEAVRLALARPDVNIVAVDRDADALGAVADSAARSGCAERLHTIEADVGSVAGVESFVREGIERWDGLDGIFNVAGIAVASSILDMSADQYERTMAVNARSTWLAMKHAIPALLERGGGRIVNVGSNLSVSGGAAFSAYAASKHAVVGMTKSIALEYAAQGIVANVLCPGGMDTPMVWEAFRQFDPEDPEKARDAMLATRIPNGRLARPDELASTGLWFLLDAPAHLSGQVLCVDGGKNAG